jgi:hypothetical protein
MANYFYKNGSYEEMWDYIKSIDKNFNENFEEIKEDYSHDRDVAHYILSKCKLKEFSFNGKYINFDNKYCFDRMWLKGMVGVNSIVNEINNIRRKKK